MQNKVHVFQYYKKPKGMLHIYNRIYLHTYKQKFQLIQTFLFFGLSDRSH